MSRYRTLLTLGIILGLPAVAYYGMRHLSNPGHPSNLVYYYNEKTKTLFSASDQSLPPVDTESGPATGVRAYVFTCGDPKDQKGHFIAYIEKLTPAGRQAMLQELKTDKSPLALGFAMEQHGASVLVRSPQNGTWYPKYSPEGLAVMKAGKESGGCVRPTLCLP